MEKLTETQTKELDKMFKSANQSIREDAERLLDRGQIKEAYELLKRN